MERGICPRKEDTQMGITSSNKVVDRSEIGCDGVFQVTLALTAAPDIIENPTDIVLVLDRSGSMAGVPLAALKEGADSFIDIIQQATDDGSGSGNLGSGTRMGVVSFSSTAVADTSLTVSVAELKEAVNALTAGGSTNHGDAFAKATQLLETGVNPAKVMVLFTDGNTTAGPPPAPIAAQARDKGIIIYCIGLVGADGLDVSALNDWATDPDSVHVAIAPTPADLEQIFAELAANLTKPGATNLKIVEQLNPDFEIVDIMTPAKGSVEQQSDTQLTWRMDSLGVSGVESATLAFQVRHRGVSGGVKKVNQSIQYSDAQGNVVKFPDPTVEVQCDLVVCAEPCPTPVDVVAEGCSDSVVVDVGDVQLESQGRILEMEVTVKNVCPHRRVALGVILKEVGPDGKKEPRGIKVFTIPAHSQPGCRDVRVKCIRFAVPEDVSLWGNSLCDDRRFQVQLIVHEMDWEYHCP